VSEVARCLLCERAAPRRFRARGYAIHRCAACDFEFVHPLPPPETLQAVYAKEYFRGDGCGYADYFGAERAVSDEKARARLARLEALGVRPGGAVLDVGCADGRFLLAARGRGFRVRGVEVSPEARAAVPAELSQVVHGALAEACAHGPFDAATLWDVLEHLPDPLAALRTLRDALAPRALVGVVVPVIDNANARVWPRSWDQYKPPEHLWFFSRRALRETLARELRGSVVYEGGAWRREARVLDVARPARSVLGRAVRGLERAAWRGLCAAGALANEALEDSVFVVVQTGEDR
jgi:SAM-dependent methyltransferase